jgi:urease accessory protein
VAVAVQMSNTAWRARLDLGFEHRAGRSVLAHRCHVGPLRVQRPFYPEGDGVCHVYVLHPPGGVVGGDELDIDVTVGESAAALLTTPAAGKFYRSDGRMAIQRQRLHVGAGASLEWFPQENIVFDGAHVTMTTRIELEQGANFMGWEILCLGRPGAGERFTRGKISQCWEIWCDGKPLHVERARYEQGGAALNAPWGMAGQAVCGTLVYAGKDAGLRERVCEATAQWDIEGLFSVTQLAEVLVCRYLGPHGEEARRCFIAVWEILRPAVWQRPACAPRIWAT